jgi:hypothetical protein
MFPTGSTTSVLELSAATDLSPAVITGPFTAWGQPITVAYRAVDTTLFPAAAASSSTSLKTSSTSSSSAGIFISSPSTSYTTKPTGTSAGASGDVSQGSKSASSKTSGGTIAGIAIGAVAGVALVVLAVVYFLRRQRKQKRAELDSGIADVSWYNGAAHDHNGYPKEMPAPVKPVELGTMNTPELGGTTRHELSG